MRAYGSRLSARAHGRYDPFVTAPPRPEPLAAAARVKDLARGVAQDLAGGYRRSSRALRLRVAVVGGWALLSAATIWAAISPMILSYPFTVRGQDALLWTSLFGLGLGILAAAWLRRPLSARWSAVGLTAGSITYLALPFLLGYSPKGTLAVAWWNLVLTGSALTILTLAGQALVLWRAFWARR